MSENDLSGRYVPATDWVEDAERFVSEMTLIADSIQADIDIETEVDVRLRSAWVTAEIQREALIFISASISEGWFTREAYDELVADLRFWANIAREKKASASVRSCAPVGRIAFGSSIDLCAGSSF
jgi:hypothetical protein